MDNWVCAVCAVCALRRLEKAEPTIDAIGASDAVPPPRRRNPEGLA
jgi:hypothetical protein